MVVFIAILAKLTLLVVAKGEEGDSILHHDQGVIIACLDLGWL